MGRELQKRKNRSSINKVRRKPKSKKRVLSNSIIAANWDKTQTLAQNYKRLGLTARLNKNTGGVEKSVSSLEKERQEEEDGARIENGLLIGGNKKRAAQNIDVQEVGVERDAQTGRILKVLESADAKPNPLNDPLNDLESDSETSQDALFDQHGNPTSTAARPASEGRTAVVQELQREADKPVEKYKRKQPEGERAFVEMMVRKYGDDYEKMARDIKINYMQRSEGDLKRRVKKWRESGGTIT